MPMNSIVSCIVVLAAVTGCVQQDSQNRSAQEGALQFEDAGTQDSAVDAGSVATLTYYDFSSMARDFDNLPEVVRAKASATRTGDPNAPRLPKKPRDREGACTTEADQPSDRAPGESIEIVPTSHDSTVDIRDRIRAMAGADLEPTPETDSGTEPIDP